MADDAMVIRISGPQILGYMQQVIPRDNSAPYDAEVSLDCPPPSSSAAAHGDKPPEEDDARFAHWKLDPAGTATAAKEDERWKDSEAAAGDKPNSTGMDTKGNSKELQELPMSGHILPHRMELGEKTWPGGYWQN